MALTGAGRRAQSLGTGDPRERRLAQSLADPANFVAEPIVVDAQGNITLKPAQAVSTALTGSPKTITDSTGGTASSTPALVDAGVAYSQANANNNAATLAAQYNELLTRVNSLEAAVVRLVRALRDRKIVET